jgi:hypothetical protein
MGSELQPLWHALILVVAAGVWWRLRARDERGALALMVASVLSGLAPLLTKVLSTAWAIRVFGTEGVVEAVTEGILLWLVVTGVRRRAWWIAVPAAVLLGEELDWGFVFAPDASPAPPAWLESRSTKLNFHNSALLGWLWKPLPMLAVVLLGLRPWPRPLERLAQRLELPLLRRWVVLLLPLVVAVFAFTRHQVGERFADETLELGLISLVASAWRWPDQTR